MSAPAAVTDPRPEATYSCPRCAEQVSVRVELHGKTTQGVCPCGLVVAFNVPPGLLTTH